MVNQSLMQQFLPKRFMPIDNPMPREMQLVRVCFIGEAHTALQIFPPKSQYVDHHHYCLHLYVCLSKEIVPDGLLP